MEKIWQDGMIRSGRDYYTKMVRFSDANYCLLDDPGKADVVSLYAKLLNYFDPSVHFQLFLFNRRGNGKEMARRFSIPEQNDSFNDIREEFAGIMKEQVKKGTNGILKGKYLIFGIHAKSRREASVRLSRIAEDVVGLFTELKTEAAEVGGKERLFLLHAYFHQYSMPVFRFSWKDMVLTGKSPRDYIAPMSFDFSAKQSYMCGDMHGSVFLLDILAAELTDEVLQRFLDLDRNLTISIHMETLDGIHALKLVRSKLSEMQKRKIDEQKKASTSGYDIDILPSDIVMYERDLQELLRELNSSNQKLLHLALFISCFGKTRKELSDLEAQAKGIAEQANCGMVCLDFRQEDGMNACAPLGVNNVEIGEVLNTNCAAMLIPFHTQELQTGGEPLYYGLNARTGKMVMADRKLLRTPNGVILGTPGSGKSFSAKREILGSFLTTRDDILIADPESEYHSLVKALGGQVIRLSTNSKEYLNPLDLDISQKENEEAMGMKADFVITLVDMIAGGTDGLESDEKGIIDACLRSLYDDYFQDPDPERMPTLEDLYHALARYEPEDMTDEELAKGAKKKAAHIADSLVLYVQGSQNYFNHRTNVDCNNRVICFDIRDLGSQLKELGMLVVQDAVWTRVAKNRELGKATRYFCDEFHLLLRERQTAKYMVEMWKRFRKWGGIPTGITQNVGDFLKSEEIEGILGNSDFVYLLNQSAPDQEILKDKLGLSKKQLQCVTNAEPGSGLIIYNNVIVNFVDRYPMDTKTYRMMNTRPGG